MKRKAFGIASLKAERLRQEKQSQGFEIASFRFSARRERNLRGGLCVINSVGLLKAQPKRRIGITRRRETCHYLTKVTSYKSDNHR
jgi:hypothetical protein